MHNTADSKVGKTLCLRGSRMRRRNFITLLSGVAAWPVVAWAQQVRHVPIIGYVAPTNPLIPSRSTGAFLQRLRELGWIEGQTIRIESRWAAARPERLRSEERRVG